jgi:hypothetical protein
LRNSYLRFSLQSVSGTVTHATLWVYTQVASTVGYAAHNLPSNAWGELAITLNNAPPSDAATVGSSGPAPAETWTPINVTPLVTGNGLFSLVLTSTGGDASGFIASRESGAWAPQLEIVTSPTAADTVAPPPPGIDVGPADTSQIATAAFGFSDHEAGVSFACGLDGAALAPCSSPASYSLLPIGSHTFSVTARDAAGNTSVAVSRAWNVAAAADPVIAAAGDIACGPTDPDQNGGNGTGSRCMQKATSDLIAAGGYDSVIALGDEQYVCGGFSALLQSYGPTWGRFKGITFATSGYHDYLSFPGGTDCDPTGQALGYYQYFGGAAGAVGKGYYSYDIGTWHVVSLNSKCDAAGGCDAGSPQELWLKTDLAAHPAACTLAFWHDPRFSSGNSGGNGQFDAFWRDLYAAHADVVLHGRDHDYERFAPQTPDRTAATDGIREFVVGTGGEEHTPTAQPRAANSAVYNEDTFGVLKLVLHSGSYDWQFVPVAGSTFTDSGTGTCH